jgi:hypothetical protein
MAQLELEADDDNPDSTVIGKALEQAKEVADDTFSHVLMTALKRLLHYAYGWVPPADWNELGRSAPAQASGTPGSADTQGPSGWSGCK